EAFLAGYPPEVQAVSRALRAMVQQAMPQAHEILYARHNHIGYNVTASPRPRICYICPLQDYVGLGFDYGGLLADPAGLLVGTGKRMRHVKVYALDEARRPALEHLVGAAWAEAVARMPPQP